MTIEHRNPGAVAPMLAAIVALISVQTGAAIGKSIFPIVGPEGVAALRLGISAVLLASLRPWAIWNRANLRGLLGYGVALGLMNLLIYRAFLYIPVSIAVSIEVTGPLAVALATSRRRIDLLWVALSVCGLVLLPIGAFDGRLDARGVAYAIAAALCWAAYMLAGARVAHHGRQAVATGMIIASLMAVPLGLAHAGAALFLPQVLGIGLCVALMSSMLPFLLDLFAMRHLPASVFGILMSASPAVSAVAAWLVLGEVLSPLQCMGIAAIVAACAGSTWSRATGTVKASG
jgi:inner membrane transporter RhtA